MPVPIYEPDGQRVIFVEPDVYVEAVASGKISGCLTLTHSVFK